jgi:hypothetical protein
MTSAIVIKTSLQGFVLGVALIVAATLFFRICSKYRTPGLEDIPESVHKTWVYGGTIFMGTLGCLIVIGSIVHLFI